MKKQITYKELQKFDNVATAYLIKNGYFNVPKFGEESHAGFTKKEPTKLVTNIKNILKQASKHFEEYKERLEELSLDHCAVDPKSNVILKDEKGNYQFTKDELKKLNKKIKELTEENVGIHIRITEGDFDLLDEEIEVFEGIVIPAIVKENED